MKPLQQGQPVACKIEHAEKNGYAVTLVRDGSPGFIKTTKKYKGGEEIFGVFVCEHKGRTLLSQLFGSGRMEDHSPKTVKKSDSNGEGEGETDGEGKAKKKNERKDLLKDPNAGGLFGFEYKRACDLFIGPIDLKSIKTMKKVRGDEIDLAGLIADLEEGERTVCIKANSREKRSRSAALIYKGRVVGCTHNNKKNPGYLTTEASLLSLLNDLENPATDVMIYNLPEEVVASLAALFIGSPVNRTDSMSSSEYYEYVMDWFAEKKTIACLTIVTGYPPMTNLVIVYKGQLMGVFNVENQRFYRGDESLFDLFEKFPNAAVEASVIKSDRFRAGSKLGCSLSTAYEQHTAR